MIRQAIAEDLEDIMIMIHDTVTIMQTEGNNQWSEVYPVSEDFLQDIAQGALYVYCDEHNKPQGVVCLNDQQLEAYAPLAWQLKAPAMVIHRLAVAPQARRQGIGTKLMRFAEDLASQRGFKQMRTDTYHCNERMQALFQKMGYKKVGECYFVEDLAAFYCYEKLLDPAV